MSRVHWTQNPVLIGLLPISLPQFFNVSLASLIHGEVKVDLGEVFVLRFESH